jgi:hypothetical protein
MMEDAANIFHYFGRFPSLTFTRGAKGIIVVGYRPPQELLHVFQDFVTTPT